MVPRPTDSQSSERPTGLVVDRDPTVRALIRDVFEASGGTILGAENGAEAVDLLRKRPVDLLLVDPGTPGVVQSGLVATAVALPDSPLLIGLGARDGAEPSTEGPWTDRISDPKDREGVAHVCDRAVGMWRLQEDVRELRRRLRESEGYAGIAGHSPASDALRDAVRALAESDTPVWISGPRGSEKRQVARVLHLSGGGETNGFRRVDAATLNGGAGEPHIVVQAMLASPGTVYLDSPEVLHEPWQRALASAIGSSSARLVCGSTRQPRTLVDEGLLLPDVAAQLGREHLSIPALRRRREDVPRLAQQILREIAEANFSGALSLERDALSALEGHDWPEDVSELRQALEHAAILAEGGLVRRTDLPERLQRNTQAAAGEAATNDALSQGEIGVFRDMKRDVVAHFEKRYLRALLEQHSGNVTSAAQQAGMLRSALQRLLRKYGIRSAEFRQRRGVDEARPGGGIDAAL